MNRWPGLGPDTSSTVTVAMGGGIGNRRAGVGVDPGVRDGRRDVFGLAQQPGECVAIVQIGRGDNSSGQNSGGVDQHVTFDVIDLLRAVEPTRPGHRGRLH